MMFFSSENSSLKCFTMLSDNWRLQLGQAGVGSPLKLGLSVNDSLQIHWTVIFIAISLSFLNMRNYIANTRNKQGEIYYFTALSESPPEKTRQKLFDALTRLRDRAK